MAKNSKLSGWQELLTKPFAGMAAGFGQGAAASPAAPALTGGMDFMKNMWGAMPSAVPGFVLPTIDIEELDKRIEDLRSVESWLTLNANMLKATIQGLEVQRNTLAALKALRDKGDLLSAMMKNPSGHGVMSGNTATNPGTGSKSSAESSAVTDAWTDPSAAFAEVFNRSFGADAGHANWPLQPQPESLESHQPHQSPESAAQTWPAAELPTTKPPKSGRSKAAKARGKHANTARAASGPGLGVQSAAAQTAAAQSANMWMNFLKDQFSQIAGAALLSPAKGAATVSKGGGGGTTRASTAPKAVTTKLAKKVAKKTPGNVAPRSRARPASKRPLKRLSARAKA